MSVKERILTIRLLEKAWKRPNAAANLGIFVKMGSGSKSSGAESKE